MIIYLLLGLLNHPTIIVPSNFGSFDIFILAISDDGTVKWSSNYGGSNEDNFPKIRRKRDNEFIIASHTSSNDFDVTSQIGNFDYWVFAIDSLGSICGINQ